VGEQQPAPPDLRTQCLARPKQVTNIPLGLGAEKCSTRCKSPIQMTLERRPGYIGPDEFSRSPRVRSGWRKDWP